MSFGFRTYAKRTIIDGIAFASKLEASVYAQLSLDRRHGLYETLEMQCRVDPDKCDHCGLAEAKPTKVDFRTVDPFGGIMYHEAKGLETDRWKDFVAWWRKKGPAPLRIYRDAGRGRVRMVEEIRPTR
jgi:hypothetical protein